MALSRRATAALGLSLTLTLLAGGCSDGGKEAGSGPLATVEKSGDLPGPQPTPRPHLADAVRDLLAAEESGKPAKSFLLLSRQSRVEYKDVAEWTKRRQELPAVTGFSIDADFEGDKGDRAKRVVAIVEHKPGLDPFRGLSPAREKQTFTGRREGDGWLVDADPKTDPLLPPDARAIEASTAWVAAVQACDQAKAAKLQAVPTLFGTAQGAAGLCGKQGPVTAGKVGRLAAGFASADIVAQYTSDALLWTRVVRITSPAVFGVVLAPIGDGWQVLGIAD